MLSGRAELRAMCFTIGPTVNNIAVTRKNTSYFITKMNLTFLRTQTEQNPNNEGPFPSLCQALTAI